MVEGRGLGRIDACIDRKRERGRERQRRERERREREAAIDS